MIHVRRFSTLGVLLLLSNCPAFGQTLLNRTDKDIRVAFGYVKGWGQVHSQSDFYPGVIEVRGWSTINRFGGQLKIPPKTTCIYMQSSDGQFIFSGDRIPSNRFHKMFELPLDDTGNFQFDMPIAVNLSLPQGSQQPWENGKLKRKARDEKYKMAKFYPVQMLPFKGGAIELTFDFLGWNEGQGLQVEEAVVSAKIVTVVTLYNNNNFDITVVVKETPDDVGSAILIPPGGRQNYRFPTNQPLYVNYGFDLTDGSKRLDHEIVGKKMTDKGPNADYGDGARYFFQAVGERVVLKRQ